MAAVGLDMIGLDGYIIQFPFSRWILISGLVMQGLAGALIYIPFMPVLQ